MDSCIKHPLNYETVCQIARNRWFKTIEINSILCSWNLRDLGALALPKIPLLPKTGDFFIINGNSLTKKWKHDGYQYMARKNGVGFREDVEKLKIGGEKKILCYYSYIIGDSPIKEYEQKIVMNRRIYKLLQNSAADSNFFIVHYLRECNSNSPSSHSTKVFDSVDEGQNSTLSGVQGTPSTTHFSGDAQHSPEYGNSEEQDIYARVNNRLSDIPKLQEQFSLEIEFDKNKRHNQIDNSLFDDDTDFYNSFNPFSKNEEIPQEMIPQEFVGELMACEVDEKPKAEYVALQSRIAELEARIFHLELEKRSNSGECFIEQIIGDQLNRIKIKIIDFSPEWDYVNGGNKLMICFSPSLKFTDTDIKILFGNVEQQAICVQPGVLKCQVPPHKEGFVRLGVMIKDQRIDDPLEKASMFEYRKKSSHKRKAKTKSILSADENKDTANEFKVRIIDKMTSFQDYVINQMNRHIPPNNGGSENNKNHDGKNEAEKGINTIEDVEPLLQKYKSKPEEFTSTEALRIWSILMKIGDECIGKREIINILNSLNDDGFALIHYIAALNFHELLPLLFTHGADLNIVSSSGITALHIAFSLNFEKFVELLLKYGVEISSNDQNHPNKESDTEADNNDGKNMQNKFLDMELLLKNKNVLDMLLREVTLCESLQSSSFNTDRFSWNDEEEQDEGNFLIDLMKEVERSDEENEKEPKLKTDNNHEQIIQRKRLLERKQRYLRMKKAMSKKKDCDPNGFKTSDGAEVYALHQDHIKTIQKNVRGWLLRRQYLDIKYATRLLQNCLRQKIEKKSISSDSKLKIKNKLKDWLSIKPI